jgi:hypothetical protein
MKNCKPRYGSEKTLTLNYILYSTAWYIIASADIVPPCKRSANT